MPSALPQHGPVSPCLHACTLACNLPWLAAYAYSHEWWTKGPLPDELAAVFSSNKPAAVSCSLDRGRWKARDPGIAQAAAAFAPVGVQEEVFSEEAFSREGLACPGCSSSSDTLQQCRGPHCSPGESHCWSFNHQWARPAVCAAWVL